MTKFYAKQREGVTGFIGSGYLYIGSGPENSVRVFQGDKFHSLADWLHFLDSGRDLLIIIDDQGNSYDVEEFLRNHISPAAISKRYAKWLKNRNYPVTVGPPKIKPEGTFWWLDPKSMRLFVAQEVAS